MLADTLGCGVPVSSVGSGSGSSASSGGSRGKGKKVTPMRCKCGATEASVPIPPLHGVRCSTEIYTRGCHWFPRMFASSEHACDQWHFFRVSTPLTGWHCKLRPNTEGQHPQPLWQRSVNVFAMSAAFARGQIEGAHVLLPQHVCTSNPTSRMATSFIHLLTLSTLITMASPPPQSNSVADILHPHHYDVTHRHSPIQLLTLSTLITMTSCPTKSNSVANTLPPFALL
jgi:hypothetical protein